MLAVHVHWYFDRFLYFSGGFGLDISLADADSYPLAADVNLVVVLSVGGHNLP